MTQLPYDDDDNPFKGWLYRAPYSSPAEGTYDTYDQDRWVEKSGHYTMLRAGAVRIARQLHEKAVPYFVGSAVWSHTRPRDVDVRIVLPDAEWRDRYRMTDAEWHEMSYQCAWDRRGWAYYNDMRRWEVQLAYCCGERRIDLGILSRAVWNGLTRSYLHSIFEEWHTEAPLPDEPHPPLRFHQFNVPDPQE